MTTRTVETSQLIAARVAGLAYLLIIILGLLKGFFWESKESLCN